MSDRTYRIDISYKYEVDGREFQSYRYSFWAGSSSGRKDKQAVVDRFPPGTRAFCYVNPDDPTQAVIDRGLSIEVWMCLLIGGLFGALGASGLANAYHYWRAGKSLFRRARSV